MQKKVSKEGYGFFYLLISEDFWRILGGFLFAFVFTPFVCQNREDLSKLGVIMVWTMIMVIGWSLAAWPASKLSKKLIKIIKKIYEKNYK